MARENSSGIAEAIDNLRVLVVKRRAPGEWLVKLPFAPWRFRAAQQERQNLLNRMLTDTSVGVFLIDPDDREYLSDAIAVVERPPHESTRWLCVRSEHVGRAAEDLHIGSWVLFLLNGLPDEPLPPPNYLDTVPNSATRMLGDLGAYACVRSWEDNIEWTIVEPAR